MNFLLIHIIDRSMLSEKSRNAHEMSLSSPKRIHYYSASRKDELLQELNSNELYPNFELVKFYQSTEIRKII